MTEELKSLSSWIQASILSQDTRTRTLESWLPRHCPIPKTWGSSKWHSNYGTPHKREQHRGCNQIPKQATGLVQPTVKLPKKNAEVSEKEERNIVGATSPRILPSCWSSVSSWRRSSLLKKKNALLQFLCNRNAISFLSCVNLRVREATTGWVAATTKPVDQWSHLINLVNWIRSPTWAHVSENGLVHGLQEGRSLSDTCMSLKDPRQLRPHSTQADCGHCAFSRKNLRTQQICYASTACWTQ